jgi:hypothetical protein
MRHTPPLLGQVRKPVQEARHSSTFNRFADLAESAVNKDWEYFPAA